jgi:hypothetical protein
VRWLRRRYGLALTRDGEVVERYGQLEVSKRI